MEGQNHQPYKILNTIDMMASGLRYIIPVPHTPIPRSFQYAIYINHLQYIRKTYMTVHGHFCKTNASWSNIPGIRKYEG